MMDFSDLDATALLATEESGVWARRQTEVDGLRRMLAWCDLHSVDPQSQPEAVPVNRGGDQLTYPGGEGTPGVSELSLAEFAIAGQAGYIATSNRAAAALDLRHRLPRLWVQVQRLRVEVWVAKKITAMSRRLSKNQAAIVDASVTAALDLATPKLLELAEARVIEADPDAHRARIAEDTKRVGVFRRRRRPGDAIDVLDPQPAVEAITLRLGFGGAADFTATVDEIAQRMADHHRPAHEDDVPTMGQFRARAVELLADPYAATAFLDGSSDDEPDECATPAARRPRRSAVIYVHLSTAALACLSSSPLTAPTRVEGYGPMLAEQLAELLGHRHITVKPVIDLNTGAAVDAYEHPIACQERTLLRTGGDVFPHSTTRTRRLDHDHTHPYQRHGPPGQTGDHNDAPLTRRHHRAKTHLGYRVQQLAPGAYRWETPHGLVRVVTRHGTQIVEGIRNNHGELIGELYPTRIPISIDSAAYRKTRASR